MMSPSERDRARHAVKSSRRLNDELQTGINQLRALGPLTADRLESLDENQRTVLLAFLKRFENAVEAGRRLFRAALALEAEDVLEMSAFEVLEAAQRSGVLISATGWRDVMRARNVVAHEYAMAPAEAAQALGNALTAAEAALDMLGQALFVVERPPFSTWLNEAAP